MIVKAFRYFSVRITLLKELRIPSQVISTIVLTVPTAKLIAFWDNLYRSWKVRMNNAAALLVEELVDIAVFVSQSKLYIEGSGSIDSCGSGSALTAPGPTPTGVEGSATGAGTETADSDSQSDIQIFYISVHNSLRLYRHSQADK